MANNGYPHSPDDPRINSQYERLTANNRKSADAAGTDVKEQKHGFPGSTGGKPSNLMKGDLMTWTQMLESLTMIAESIEDHESDVMEDQIDAPAAVNPVDTPEEPSGGDDELMAQLNKIFTPVLVMQGFENDVSDQINSAMSEASVLTEKNLIKFDDQTRMAQLISVCALLIARQKNSPKYQMYAKAHAIRNQMKLDIQKEEYDAAKALAQKYLVNVSTTNNSSVARNAANDLLPETQH